MKKSFSEKPIEHKERERERENKGDVGLKQITFSKPVPRFFTEWIYFINSMQVLRVLLPFRSDDLADQGEKRE